MNPTPEGWPRISAALYYDDPRGAIDWLCRAFGFEVRLLVETGTGAVAHSELVYGEGVIMVGTADRRPGDLSPRSAKGNTQSLMVYVDDVEAHLARAREAGAEITRELSVSDYGDEYWADRAYGVRDCEGHEWWFSQRLRTGDPSFSKVRNKVAKHDD